MHQDAELDEFGRSLELPKRVRAHFPRLTALPVLLNAGCADFTLPGIQTRCGEEDYFEEVS